MRFERQRAGTPRTGGRSRWALVGLLLFGTGTVTGIALRDGVAVRSASAAPAAVGAPATTPPVNVTPRTERPPEARSLSHAFAATVKAVRPSVVRVDVQRERPRIAQAPRQPRPPGLDGAPPFFGRFFAPGPGGIEGPGGERRDFPPAPIPGPTNGTGSGVLLDGAGNVVTNAHVIDGAIKVHVTLEDGRKLPARVVGRDRRTDLAIVRLERIPEKLTAARLGDSDEVEVGEWVLALGSPLGLEQTVTAGIVSGKGRVGRRVQMSGDRVREYIQTDAKINPGNSGGPLVNLDGEVIGINTLIRTGAGGAYGFAVPINEVKRVTTMLLAEGRVRYPFLGVLVQDPDMLDAAMRAKLGAHVPEKGAIVVRVTPGGPADRAGLRPGDVIVKVDDLNVEMGGDVVDYVASRPIGSDITLTYQRAGVTASLRAKLGESGGESLARAGEQGRFGLALQSLTPQLAESLGLPPDTRGVAIADVLRGSAAERAGLRPGDAIVDVDRKPVATADDAVTALKKAGTHLLRVRGPIGYRFVTVKAD